MNAATVLSILITTLLVGAALGGLFVWNRVAPRTRLQPLPTQWNLAARRVLNTSERRFYNQLRLAFPKYIVLPKLPLVRLCQPATPEHVTYWYELIGSAHVTFAVCNPNGHVLLVIDLDGARSHSRRSTRIKESVLAACGIQRLQFGADALPSIDELRAVMSGVGTTKTVGVPVDAPVPPTTTDLVETAEDVAPAQAVASVPKVAPGVAPAYVVAASAMPADSRSTAQHTEPPANWQDPNVFLDSFFTTDEHPGSESANESAPEWTDWPPSAGSSPRGDGASVIDEEADTRWRRAPVSLAGGR